MARPRLPRVYGIVQFTFRFLSLASFVGALAILIRLSAKYKKAYGTAYAAVSAMQTVTLKEKLLRPELRHSLHSSLMALKL
jgi:hypothetical protein